MKTVHIVGAGVGSMTVSAVETIASCDVILGSRRLLELPGLPVKPSHAEYEPDAVRRIIEESDQTVFAVLVSGDVGFFSGARRLVDELGEFDVRLTAGVPVLCEFCARLRLPWQDAALISMHGAAAPLVDTVRRNRLSFCLTGGNTEKIGKALASAGFGRLTVHVGENLGCDQECVYTTEAQSLTKTASLTVLLIENPDACAAVSTGLPDTAFIRENGVPMTKSEVRAVILSKLRLRPDYICYDIGAGTGSVTIESALSVYGGHVYAIERDRNAARLIDSNCVRFNTGNVTIIKGKAPGALDNLPPPDAAFIGGNGGEFPRIVESVLQKNRSARLTATAIAIESAYAGLKAFESAGVRDVELIHMNVSRAEKRAGLNMLIAQNPIFIISGGGVKL